MHRYGVRDVEALLRLPRSTIRALIAAGFVSPTRGPRGAWRFSFQDLIVLRTAQALVEAKVPQRRITQSVRELRRHLPEAMPLSGLSIGAVGERVVVRERGGRWRVDSGQYLLEFEGDPAQGSLSVIDRTQAPPPGSPQARGGAGKTKGTARDVANGARGWFDLGLAQEGSNVDAAVAAYERALAADPAFLDAHINLGRLLHEAKRFARAERTYRDAVERCGKNPVLLYNLGVLLDDLDRKLEAKRAYEAALEGDPGLADCHYNLALLCERLARPRDAIRHMARYRALVGAS